MSASMKLSIIALIALCLSFVQPAARVAAQTNTPPQPKITYQVIEDEAVGQAEGNVAVAAPQQDGVQIAAAAPLGFKYQGYSMGSGDQRISFWDVQVQSTDMLTITLSAEGKDPIVQVMPIVAREYPGHVVARNVADKDKAVHWKLEYRGQTVAEFDLMVLGAPVHLGFQFTSATNCDGNGDYRNDPGIVAFLDGSTEPFYARWHSDPVGTFGPFTFVTGQHTMIIKAFAKQNNSDNWQDWTELHGQLTVQFTSACGQQQPVEQVTISGICPTPGQDSADLSLTGVFTRDGMPVAEQQIVITLPNGQSANATTNANGEYSYTFVGAKDFIGQNISVVAATASNSVTINADMFTRCVSAPVEGLTINAVCPTPGVDSNDLSVSGAYVVNGLPVAGAEVSISLPSGEIVKVTTGADGKFAYEFKNAKGFVGQDISAVAGTASAKLTIAVAMFERCVSQLPVNGVQITATCPTPGKESKDLSVAGAAFVDNQPVAGAVVTLKLGSKELAQVTTAQDGTFAFMFRNAKAEIGKTLSATFNDSSDSLVISADLFTTCVKRGNGKVEPQFSSYVQCAQLPADGNGNAPKDWVRNLVFDGLKGAESETIISATVTADYITYAQFGRGTKVIGIDPRAIRLNQQIAATWKVSYVNSTSGEFKVRVFDRGFDTFDPNNQDTWKNYAIVDELGRFVVWGGSKENRAEFIRVLEYNKWLCKPPTTTTIDTPEPKPEPQPEPRTICVGLDGDGNKQYAPTEDDAELDSPGCTAGDLVEDATQTVATSPNASGAALALLGYLIALALILANAAKQLGLI